MIKYAGGLICILMIFLSGCAAESQPRNFSQRKAMEEAGWAKQGRLAAVRCGIGPYPVEPEAAVIVSDCVTDLVKKHVLPNALSPEILIASRAEAARIAQEYAEGKLTPTEYKKKSEERLQNYQTSLALLSERHFY